MPSVLFCLRLFVFVSQFLNILTLTTKEACIVDLPDTELTAIDTNSNAWYLGKQTSMETCSKSCFDVNYLCDKQITDTLLYNKANRWIFDNDNCSIQSTSTQNDYGSWILITDDILSNTYSIELQLSFPAGVGGVGNAGLAFKAQDVHHTNYFVGLQPKSKEFVVGRYEEWGWSQDEYDTIHEYDTMYTIRVDVDNNKFYTYLDNVLMGPINGYSFDSTLYSQSYIGLMTWRTGPIQYSSLKIKYSDDGQDIIPICKAYTFNKLDNKCNAYFVEEYMDSFTFKTVENTYIDSAVVYYKNISSETCNDYLIRNGLLPTKAPSFSPTTLEPTAPSVAPSATPSIIPSVAPSIISSVVPTVNPTDIVVPTGIDIDINIDITFSNNTNITDEDIHIFLEDTIEALLSDKLDVDGDDIYISITNKNDTTYSIQAIISTKGGGLSADYINQYLQEQFVDDLENILNDDEDVTDITISVGNTPKTTMDDNATNDIDDDNDNHYIIIIILSMILCLFMIICIYFVFDKVIKKKKIAEQQQEGTHFAVASMSDLSNKYKGDTNNINLNLSAPYSSYNTPKMKPINTNDDDMVNLNTSTPITPQSPSDDNERYNNMDTVKMNVNENKDGIDGMNETDEENDNDDLYNYPGAHQTAGGPDHDDEAAVVPEPEPITVDGLPQIPPEIFDNDDDNDNNDGNNDNEDSDDIYSEAPASPMTPKYIE